MKISIHALREEGDFSEKIPLVFYRKFLSTPSARRATTPDFSMYTDFPISIHALREEGDAYISSDYANSEEISIHALREEGDRTEVFVPRSSHQISIHALREEGDIGRESADRRP